MAYFDYVQDRKAAGGKTFISLKRWQYYRSRYSHDRLVYYGLKKKMPKRKGIHGGFPGQGPWKKRRAFRQGFDRVGGNYRRFPQSGGELKWLDTNLDVAALTAAAQFIPSEGLLNTIVQGTGESQRVGRKTVIKKIHMRYNLNLFAGISQANHEDVRVILYVDKQANGAIGTAITILQTDNFQSYRNMENVGRYTVLMDRMHAMNHSAAGGNGTAIETCTTTSNYRFNKNCNIPIEFSGANGTIDEVRSNNIGLMVLCATGGVVKFEGICRIRYTD